MNNVEIIKGIDTTIKGLETIKNALVNSDVVKEEPKKVETKKEEVTDKKVVEETAPQSNGTLDFDVDSLKAMKYNDFKKLAAQLGVKCTGTRDEIMSRILELNNDVNVEVEDTKEVEEVEEEKVVPISKKKPLKKKAEPKEEEPKKDEYDIQAEEIAKETPIEDIIEALADVDLKANKRNAITVLAKALRENILELDAEDEEEVEEVAEDTVDEEEIGADSYFAEFDPNGYNDPNKMTEDRLEAIETKMDEILTNYSEGALTTDDITSYLEDNATEEELELLGDDYEDEDLLKMYMELVKRTIDNEGVEHEPADPYELGKFDMCCGHELKYSKATKKYICETCGTEYEAE